MSRATGLWASAAVACVIAMTLSFIPLRDSQKAGQMVFVPGKMALLPEATEAAAIMVSQCLPSSLGLTVKGSLDQPAGSIYVIATGGDPTQAGVRVGRADLKDRFSGNSLLGDFEATLPWAGGQAGFAASEWQFESPVASSHGPVTACP